MGLRKGQKHSGSFKPGNKANPTGENGRKKDARELAATIDEFMREVVAIKDGGEKRARYLWLTEIMWKHAMQGNAPYLRELLDRWVGKAKEHVELTGADGKPLSTIVILPPNPLDVA